MTINEMNFAGKKAIVRVDFNVPLTPSSPWVRLRMPYQQPWVCP